MTKQKAAKAIQTPAPVQDPSPAPVQTLESMEQQSTTKFFDVRLRTGDFTVESKFELDKKNPWGDLANIIATRGWLEFRPGRFLRYSAVQMVMILGES